MQRQIVINTISYMTKKIWFNIRMWHNKNNIKTHKIISDNINSSPVYSGSIQGSGPRYCQV